MAKRLLSKTEVEGNCPEPFRPVLIGTGAMFTRAMVGHKDFPDLMDKCRIIAIQDEWLSASYLMTFAGILSIRQRTLTLKVLNFSDGERKIVPINRSKCRVVLGGRSIYPYLVQFRPLQFDVWDFKYHISLRIGDLWRRNWTVDLITGERTCEMK